MSEIAEMTMSVSVGGFSGSLTLPYYPWSARDIEAMGEEERKAYLELQRATREQVTKKK